MIIMNKSHLVKKSFRLTGHATSIALEPIFWTVLQEMAKRQGISMAALVSAVDQETPPNLASALRVLVVKFLQKKA